MDMLTQLLMALMSRRQPQPTPAAPGTVDMRPVEGDVVAPPGLTPEELKLLMQRIEDKTGRPTEPIHARPGQRALVGGVGGTLR